MLHQSQNKPLTVYQCGNTTNMASVCTLEKVLMYAKNLVTRLKDHETTADNLLSQTQDLSKRVDAMKTYQENLGILNEMAKQRPPVDIVLGLVQENSEIGELHRENASLRYSLDEHQLAIELIMSRYREQVTQLVTRNRLDRTRLGESPDYEEEIASKIGQICNMADVMRSAVDADGAAEVADTERLTQLQMENVSLRELLSVGRQSLASPVSTRGTQTDASQGQGGDATAEVVEKEDWNDSVGATVLYSAQSLPPHVARRFGGSLRSGHAMDSRTSDDRMGRDADEHLDSFGRFSLAENRNVDLRDDADDDFAHSSGTATPDLDLYDLVDGGDNVSVHTIGDKEY